ncbi:TonB-dependent receptor plug domain-containing protein, partial [Streptococcus suis]|uniref:TonB-dependent receptor plug domain-containing protein n=1 Tax=Streptococcus suis TaxID=1307 RepID=UPI003CC7F31B
MQERGDYALVDAVTRTVGLTASSTPGNGGLAFSSRGFAGVNSVGVAEDGRRAAWTGLADVWQRHHGRHGQRHPQAAQPHQLGRGAGGRGHGRHAAPGPG